MAQNTQCVRFTNSHEDVQSVGSVLFNFVLGVVTFAICSSRLQTADYSNS